LQAATCGGRCRVQCFNPDYNPGAYPGWNICFGSKIKQPSGEWHFQSSPPNGPYYIECKCRHSKICRKPGELVFINFVNFFKHLFNSFTLINDNTSIVVLKINIIPDYAALKDINLVQQMLLQMAILDQTGLMARTLDLKIRD